MHIHGTKTRIMDDGANDTRTPTACLIAPLPRRRKATATTTRGTVLLLALLIMTTVVVGSVGLSGVILDSLRQSRAVDASTIAYYAAEAGIEDAIYTARKRNVLPDDVSGIRQTNGAEWRRTVTGAEDVIYTDVRRDTVAEIDLFDPDMPTSATGISTVEVRWSDDCGGCSMLRASLVGWTPGSAVVWNPDTPTYSYSGGIATVSLGSPARLYKLRMLARNADLIDMTIRAYDTGGNQVPIPGRVRVESRGTYNGVERLLVASMPRTVPLAGLFNFVIFSECSLVKARPFSCP